MIEQNDTVVSSLIDAIDQFERQQLGLEDVHARLQSALALLERRDRDGAQQAIRVAEADLEHIRFARLQSEQHTAAMFRLRELRLFLRRGDGGVGGLP